MQNGLLLRSQALLGEQEGVGTGVLDLKELVIGLANFLLIQRQDMDARLILHHFNPAHSLHPTIQRLLVLYQIVDVLVDLLSSLLLLAVCLQSVAFLICVICPVHVLVGELQGLNLSGVVRGLGSLLSTPDFLVESSFYMWL